MWLFCLFCDCHLHSPAVPLLGRDVFQDPQWMPETVDSTEPHIRYVFSYDFLTYIPVIKFNL